MSHPPIEGAPASPATPTQVANPGRATLRTFLAALLGFAPLVNGVLLAVQDWLAQNTDVVPAELALVVNGVLVAGLALAALVTRVLAVPGVNDWLRDHMGFLAADNKGRHEA